MNILLSIIIPVYNTPLSLLKKCFHPLIINKDSRIEVIIVDDGSNKVTSDFLDGVVFGVQSKVVHIKNQGQNRARNVGLSLSTGKYIGFLDSDDIIDINVLQQMFDKDLWNNDIIVYKSKLINEDGSLLKIISKNSSSSKKEYLSNCAELWAQFFKKSFLINNGGLFLFDGPCIGEDLASVVPLVIKANNICYTNYCVYNYVRHSFSVIHSMTADKHMSMLTSFQNILFSISKNDISIYFDEIEWQAINHILNYEVRFQLSSGMHGLKNARILFSWVNDHFPNWKNNTYLQKRYKKQSFLFKLAINHQFILILFLQKLKTIYYLLRK